MYDVLDIDSHQCENLTVTSYTNMITKIYKNYYIMKVFYT